MEQEIEKFSPITHSECEIFQTVSFLSKLPGRREFFREELRKKSEQDESCLHDKLAYAVFNLVAGNEENVLECKTNVENAIATFEEIIELNPECWLAQIYRIRVLLMLPCNFRDEEEVAEDIDAIIEIQKKSTYQPYFVIPYLMISELYWSIGENEKADSYLKEAQKLKIEKIKVIPDYLILIFEDLERKLRKSAKKDFADCVEQMKYKYFEV